jgi:hypothetical protein
LHDDVPPSLTLRGRSIERGCAVDDLVRELRGDKRILDNVSLQIEEGANQPFDGGS